MIAAVDVAVIGAGIAGTSAALEARRHGVATTLVTDGPVGRSNSIMAQGGIQIPRGDDSDLELMVQDMMSVGGDEVDVARVERFVGELPGLLSLLESWGLEFDRDETGELVRRIAGGMSTPRVLTVGDHIGRPLMRLLRSRVEAVCDVLSSCSVSCLDVDQDFHLMTTSGEVRAKAVVVAVGGTAYQEALATGQLTSNPPNENARIRASLEGLGLRELAPRRFQWHPFGLVGSRKGITLACVPESVSALGPRLITTDGEIVALPRPRSEVVFAMREARTKHSAVRITLADLAPEVLARFPKVQRYIRDYGEEPEVVPVLHYELSGFPTAVDQSTGVPGLFLAGEIVGGIHGRERLMGAGVADSLVHGRRAGESAARFVMGG